MIDYSLYLITDEKLKDECIIETVMKAIKGGVTIIQYRNKQSDTKKMVKEALYLHKITQKNNIPLIINDRIDVALAVNAEGVHVGQNDMPASVAKKLIGPKKILGVSVKTIKEANKAIKDGADYLGVGDIFGTKSKNDAGRPIGIKTLKKISKISPIPVVGIGGITKKNAGSVVNCGVDGIAVISAIMGKLNPKKEAKELFNITKKEKSNNKSLKKANYLQKN